MKKNFTDKSLRDSITTPDELGLYTFLVDYMSHTNGELPLETIPAIVSKRFSRFSFEKLHGMLNDSRLFGNDGRKVWSHEAKAEIERTSRLSEIRRNASRKRWDAANAKKQSPALPKRFQPPTLPEVESYVNENRFDINPRQFIDYYQSKGWMSGKSKIVDWQAAVRAWVRNSVPVSTPRIAPRHDSRFINDEWNNIGPFPVDRHYTLS